MVSLEHDKSSSADITRKDAETTTLLALVSVISVRWFAICLTICVACTEFQIGNFIDFFFEVCFCVKIASL